MENDNKVTSRNTGKRSALLGISIIIILVLIFCLCIGGCLALTIAAFQESDFGIDESTVTSGNNNEKVAVINIDGVITSTGITDFFSSSTQKDMASIAIEKLDRAKNDENVKAVILDINSPGGEVYASELIYNKIIEVKEANKVVVALFRDTAASGAYYIAAPADHIIASETTITGSIGVRLQAQDLSGLYEKLGIETIDIVNSNGDFKIITNDIQNEDSEAYKVYQTILDDVYSQFVDVIVDGRNLTEAQVIELADGRVYSGKAASENGLVDSLGYFEDALTKVAELADLDSPRVIRYEDTSPYWSELGFKIKAKVDQMFNLVPANSYKTQLLYLLTI